MRGSVDGDAARPSSSAMIFPTSSALGGASGWRRPRLQAADQSSATSTHAAATAPQPESPTETTSREEAEVSPRALDRLVDIQLDFYCRE
jgi:hypothetical protein